jgi:hypothetical protein
MEAALTGCGQFAQTFPIINQHAAPRWNLG